MRRPLHVARKSFKVGDRVVQPGDPVPEAADWRHVETWINQGFLVVEFVDADEETLAAEADVTLAALDELTVPELREAARERDLSGYSKMTRVELVALLAGDTAD